MRALLCCALIASIAIRCLAINELGSLTDARKSHPAIFVPGNVLKYMVSGKNGYVYNGEAEQCFAGSMAESDAELYQEAVLDAKNNLYKFLTKGDKSLSVQMSGAVKLYEFVDDKYRRVVCFVAKDNVVISQKPKIENRIDAVPVAELKTDDSIQTQAVVRIEANKDVQVKDDGASQLTSQTTQVVESVQQSEITPADKLAECLNRLSKNPSDCLLLSRAARLYMRQEDVVNAKNMYSRMVQCIVSNERIEREIAAELLAEAAAFSENTGDVNTALKYYRLLIRCDGMRRWKLGSQIDAANRKISQLLLKSF